MVPYHERKMLRANSNTRSSHTSTTTSNHTHHPSSKTNSNNNNYQSTSSHAQPHKQPSFENHSSSQNSSYVSSTAGTPSISNKRTTHTNVNSQFRSKRPSQLNTISSPPTTTNVNTNANAYATTTTGAEKLTSIHPPPISSSATSTSYHRPPSWNYYGAIQFFFKWYNYAYFKTFLYFYSFYHGNRTRTSSMESESPATIITANRYPIYLDWIIVKAVQVVTYPR